MSSSKSRNNNNNDDIEILFECNPVNKNFYNNRFDDDDDEILLLQEYIPSSSSDREKFIKNDNNDVIFVKSVENKNKKIKIDDYFTKLKVNDKNNNKNILNDSLSLNDPRLEILDPTPDIHRLFLEFDEKFFEKKLSKQKNLKLIWCNRLTKSAGLFKSGWLYSNTTTKNERKYCQEIRLSSKLLSLRLRSDLINTLLHEMIHAYIFYSNIRDTDSHGQYFQEFMYKINSVAKTSITVYHNFNDEVKYIENDLPLIKKNNKENKRKNNQQQQQQKLIINWLNNS